MGFSDTQISKWANDYEKELCSKENLIADRFALEVTSNVSEYELPNYITNIRCVLYKGYMVYPKGFQASIMMNDSPFQSINSNRPIEYIASGKGLRIIKFFPSPSETIATINGDLWNINADNNGVIIEFYRTPSLINENLRLPEWNRRYLLKDYICWKAFSNEGKDQDLKAATYYTLRMGEGVEYLKVIKDNMYQASVNVLNPVDNRREALARPVLPSNFGTIVNW